MHIIIFSSGLLNNLRDIDVALFNDFILLTWSPSFSLNVTEGEPDIWYSVLIMNVTDEDSPRAVSCIDCLNFTEASYAFTHNSLTQPHYTISPCHNYSFTVIPQNKVGNGSRSEPVYGHFLIGMECASAYKTSAYYSMCKYSSELEAIFGDDVNITRSVVGRSGTVITLDLPVS